MDNKDKDIDNINSDVWIVEGSTGDIDMDDLDEGLIDDPRIVKNIGLSAINRKINNIKNIKYIFYKTAEEVIFEHYRGFCQSFKDRNPEVETVVPISIEDMLAGNCDIKPEGITIQEHIDVVKEHGFWGFNQHTKGSASVIHIYINDDKFMISNRFYNPEILMFIGHELGHSLRPTKYFSKKLSKFMMDEQSNIYLLDEMLADRGGFLLIKALEILEAASAFYSPRYEIDC